MSKKKKTTGEAKSEVPLAQSGSGKSSIVLDLDNDGEIVDSEGNEAGSIAGTDGLDITNAEDEVALVAYPAVTNTVSNDTNDGLPSSGSDSKVVCYNLKTPGTVKHIQLLDPVILKRVKLLTDDADAPELSPDHILCRVCEGWIRYAMSLPN